jgi:hypothetical protein
MKRAFPGEHETPAAFFSGTIVPRALLALVFAVSLVEVGCHFVDSNIFVSSADKIYGNYSLKTPDAVVELELPRDMRFKETVKFYSGKTTVITGRWWFDLIDDEGEVELDGGARLSKNMSPDAMDRIDTGMDAENWFGGPRLCANAAEDLYFARTESK